MEYEARIWTEDGTEIGSFGVVLSERNVGYRRSWRGYFTVPDDVAESWFNIMDRRRYYIELDDGRRGLFLLRRLDRSGRPLTVIKFVGTGALDSSVEIGPA